MPHCCRHRCKHQRNPSYHIHDTSSNLPGNLFATINSLHSATAPLHCGTRCKTTVTWSVDAYYDESRKCEDPEITRDRPGRLTNGHASIRVPLQYFQVRACLHACVCACKFA